MGYQQLQAIAQALHEHPALSGKGSYLGLLTERLDWVVEKNRRIAEDLQAAHQALCQVADCLGYPPQPASAQPSVHPPRGKLNSLQVAQQVNDWIQHFQPVGKLQHAQIALFSALKKRWQLFGHELLACYDIPGLPQDNLQLEARFGRLRRHQRRISGRKSTRELHDLGQVQVLFQAQSQADLLSQIQHVSQEDYRLHRQRLAKAEAPRQFFRHLHHDPLHTISTLISHHEVACSQPKPPMSPAHSYNVI